MPGAESESGLTFASAEGIVRARISIKGLVQGVGFRPFIYRLATELALCGWVSNNAQGVIIEVEADQSRLDDFIARIERDKPAQSSITALTVERLQPTGCREFAIHHSDESGRKTALVLPDLATCPECAREILDPANRRYRYPFTNCTHCGPRYSIIQALPYDRPATTMKQFVMCPACRAEYENPLDRRFHAQPNACPVCGPQLALWARDGGVLAAGDDALLGAVIALRRGQIVAVKGLGGFHLMCDARSVEAVRALRQRKRREAKPLALMVPSLDATRSLCEVSPLEAALLSSQQAPIVLLRQLAEPTLAIAKNVAPANPYLGVMLPYTPLHLLLMRELGFPVVATSGNLSDEPICIDEYEALHRLSGIADLFLVHNRPIERHIDDSIVRVMAGEAQIVRRARGYAPLPIDLDFEPPPMIAVGGHLKNTVAVTAGSHVFLSQHIGDLESVEATDAFTRTLGSLQQLYEVEPQVIACDLHPDYRSTLYADSTGLPVVRVQHHYAHALACMAEHKLSGSALAVVWDGTGYGTDGTIWGGEFLRIDDHGFTRAACLRPFHLPGGDSAVREPRRSALGLLHAVYGDAVFAMRDLAPLAAFSDTERTLLRSMLARGFNAPLTSSAGRLFDAVSALCGLRQKSDFEGQAAMDLEFAAYGANADKCYPYLVTDNTSPDRACGLMIDWNATVTAMVEDVRRNRRLEVISATFHNTMADIIVQVAQRLGEDTVLLTGGCFQNQTLTERTIEQLRAAGFTAYWHHTIPTNDGGIALGQIAAAARSRREV